MRPILFQGSVKNIRGIEGESPLLFEFSDHYSIFDWGRMPDQLDGKGKALTFMGSLFFKLLGDKKKWQQWHSPHLCNDCDRFDHILNDFRKSGVRSHYLGEVGPNLMAIEPVKIFRPDFVFSKDHHEWDYSAYKDRPLGSLVPLEVIFRFGVPKGSSLFERVKDSSYCQEIGLKDEVRSGDIFELPIVEFSTKLETSDRYIDYKTAQGISGMTDSEFERLHRTTILLALRLKDLFAEVDVELWDGKFEFAFNSIINDDGQRDFMLVDSIGPDELRISYDDFPLSKESIRSFYRGSSWHIAIKDAQEIAKERGEKDWKQICIQELNKMPEQMDFDFKSKMERMYKSLCNSLSNHFLDKSVFLDSGDLEEFRMELQ